MSLSVNNLLISNSAIIDNNLLFNNLLISDSLEDYLLLILTSNISSFEHENSNLKDSKRKLYNKIAKT